LEVHPLLRRTHRADHSGRWPSPTAFAVA
jgi:hypothetical protein